MTKYFAIWLPVEGEPKEGDMTVNKKGELFPVDKGRAAMFAREDVKKHLENKISKVRLFLCTREIYIGDKVLVTCPNHKKYTGKTLFCIGISPDNFIQLANRVDAGIADLYLGRKQCCKVIGEISLDAIWVKEGDEFDNSDIEEWWGQAKTHYPMIKKLTERLDKELLSKNCPIVFKIKGACGHFH